MPVPYPKDLLGEAAIVQQRLSELQVHWPEEIALSFHPDSSAYAFHPYLFREAFPDVEIEIYRSLATAILLIAGAVCVRDQLMDGLAEPDLRVRNIFRLKGMEFEAYRIFYHHFPSKSRFWDRYRQYAAEYAGVDYLESLFVARKRPWDEFSDDIALAIAEKNSALACITIAALVEYSGNDELYDPLLTSVEKYNVARQVWDDVCDWKEDLLDGIPSLALGKVFRNHPKWETHPRDAALVEKVAKEVYYRNYLVECLDLAIQAFDDAQSVVSHLPGLSWNWLLDSRRTACKKLRQDIRAIVAKKMEGPVREKMVAGL